MSCGSREAPGSSRTRSLTRSSGEYEGQPRVDGSAGGGPAGAVGFCRLDGRSVGTLRRNLHRLRLLSAGLVGVAAAALVVTPAARGQEKRRPNRPTVAVRVVARDFSFVLSRKNVPLGAVRFVVVNEGFAPHDFAIAGVKTRLLQHGERAVLQVTLGKSGGYAYRCTVPGHAEIGMRGVFAVGRGAVGAVRPPRVGRGNIVQQGRAAVTLTPIGSFERPVYAASPPGDPRELFVVEAAGVIRKIVDGRLLPTPFLDISSLVANENENGLLSMAFAPDYAASGRFYVYFNDRVGNRNVNLVEFRRSASDPDRADPSTYRQILHIVKPWANHNGGMMEFGPDGFLYVAVGDGDSGYLNKPGAFAQTLDDLLGSILRIDPLHREAGAYSVPASNPFAGRAGDRGEIWAYGLRNPWRFWIDPPTGDIYVADVGLGGPEEIDYVQSGTPGGENFGWPCYQGSVGFDSTAVCANAVAPILEYKHDTNLCSVIGGLVVRDPRLPALDGRYLYSDFCGGEIQSLVVVNGKARQRLDLGVRVPMPSSFGEDGLRRVYVLSVDGSVYRLDPPGGQSLDR